MINSLTMSGYRAFDRFEMTGLGRVNLLVGRNNTGKTSILEALYLLASRHNPNGLWQVLARRGEQVLPDPTGNRVHQAEADLSHLFHGHELADGAEFTLSTKNDEPERTLTYRIREAKPTDFPQGFALLNDEGLPGPRLALWITGKPKYEGPPIPLSRAGSLRVEILQQVVNLQPSRNDTGSAQFLTTESFTVAQVGQMWNSIVLTPDEERVIKALQMLDPRIERIAQVQTGIIQLPGQGFMMPTRGGYFLRLSGDNRRVPIGSFGDGAWRIFALAVALVRARDSLLLIDEIDTGLHYTVMSDMWKLVQESAASNNVQVFATTHSADCVQSLASICAQTSQGQSGVTIQRVERGKNTSVPFSEDEVRVAAQNSIEVR